MKREFCEWCRSTSLRDPFFGACLKCAFQRRYAHLMNVWTDGERLDAWMDFLAEVQFRADMAKSSGRVRL